MEGKSSVASSNVRFRDQGVKSVGQRTRDTKRSKSSEVPKVNPHRKRPGTTTENVLVIDAPTDDVAYFSVDKHEPCPPPDDDGRRNANESTLRSLCGDITEA